MRIFVAGGTGAVGRPLVRALAAAGHEITVFSRSEGRVAALGVPTAVPAVGDAFDADSLRRPVGRARPEVVVNQLTASPSPSTRLQSSAGSTSPAVSAARCRARSLPPPAARERAACVAQSISFAYRPGPGLRTEADPLWTDAPGQIGLLTRSLAALESATLRAPDIEGVVLRYGSFYGPGTYFACRTACTPP